MTGFKKVLIAALLFQTHAYSIDPNYDYDQQYLSLYERTGKSNLNTQECEEIIDAIEQNSHLSPYEQAVLLQRLYPKATPSLHLRLKGVFSSLSSQLTEWEKVKLFARRNPITTTVGTATAATAAAFGAHKLVNKKEKSGTPATSGSDTALSTHPGGATPSPSRKPRCGKTINNTKSGSYSVLGHPKPPKVEKGVYDRLGMIAQAKLPAFDNNSKKSAAQMQQQIRHGFLCGAIGDAMGNIDEFNVISKLSPMKKVRSIADMITHKDTLLPTKGNFLTADNKVAVTDDTIMSSIILEVAPAHKDKRALELLSILGKAYHEDAKTGKYGGWNKGFRAPGGRCIAAAKNMNTVPEAEKDNPLWVYAGAQDNASGGGCGTIMRSAAYGWVFHNDIAKAARTAALDMITHGADSSIIASACFAAANAAALQGKNIDKIITIVTQVAHVYDTTVSARRNDKTSVVKKLTELKDTPIAKLATPGFYEKYKGWGAADFLIATLGTTKKFADKTIQDGVLAVVHSEVKQTIDRDSVASGVAQLMGAMGIDPGFNLETDGKHLELHDRRLEVAKQATSTLFS